MSGNSSRNDRYPAIFATIFLVSAILLATISGHSSLKNGIGYALIISYLLVFLTALASVLSAAGKHSFNRMQKYNVLLLVATIGIFALEMIGLGSFGLGDF